MFSFRLTLQDINGIIVNQTNYSKEKALEKLKEWDYDYMNVIREYLNPNFNQKKPKSSKSVNQMMMTEIRKAPRPVAC